MIANSGPRLACLWVACAVSASFPAYARVYPCEDSTGRIILRDVPCKRGEVTRQQDAAPVPEAPAQPVEPKTAAKPQQKLTEPMVREFAQNLDAAFMRHDLKQLTPLLAEDAVFEMEYRLPEGVQVVRATVEQYVARVREGFKLNDYVYQRERSDILLSPGELHAEIVTAARQTCWFSGQWQTGAIRSRWSVEMRDGRPQVTLLRSVISPL
jgi:uncharacterized protein DUF4124